MKKWNVIPGNRTLELDQLERDFKFDQLYPEVKEKIRKKYKNYTFNEFIERTSKRK